MVSRRYGEKSIKTCPVCGKHMEVGSRVKVQMSWEMDGHRKLASASGYVCRNCAEPVAERSALDVPDQVWRFA